MKYKVGDLVENPTIDLLDDYTAEWVDVGVVRITGIVEKGGDNDREQAKQAEK